MTMTFTDCVLFCAENSDLVREFNRLYDRNFGRSLRSYRPRTGIEMLVDQACGFDGQVDEDPDDVRAFTKFVWDCVWTRLPPTAFES